MSVYKDEKKGTWYCKFRYKDWQGNRKETTKRGFKTKREAKEYEDRAKTVAQESVHLTLQNLADEYMDYLKRNLSENTFYNRQIIIKKHILPYFSNAKLSDITPLKINRWQTEITQGQLEESSVRLVDRTFSAMLNFAVKFFNLRSNPFKITGHVGSFKKRLQIWTVEEFQKVEECMQQIRAKGTVKKTLAIKILFYSGMRSGELFALKTSDFDFQNNTISITHSYNTNLKLLGSTKGIKSNNSDRTIAMPALLMQEIHQHLSSYYQIPVYPFRINNQTLLRFMTRAAKMAGVKRIVLHSLRHSHISYLISQGIPITNIAKRAGDTIETIMKTYAHPSDNIESTICAKLNEIVGQNVVIRSFSKPQPQ